MGILVHRSPKISFFQVGSCIRRSGREPTEPWSGPGPEHGHPGLVQLSCEGRSVLPGPTTEEEVEARTGAALPPAQLGRPRQAPPLFSRGGLLHPRPQCHTAFFPLAPISLTDEDDPEIAVGVCGALPLHQAPAAPDDDR